MTYKGYQAAVELDAEAGLFHGEVLNTRDVITFQGTSVDELKQAFEDSVDDYLDFCRSRGETPEKPFSGKFLVRVPPEIHRQVMTEAQRQGKSLNAYVLEKLIATSGKPAQAIIAKYPKPSEPPVEQLLAERRQEAQRATDKIGHYRKKLR